MALGAGAARDRQPPRRPSWSDGSTSSSPRATAAGPDDEERRQDPADDEPPAPRALISRPQGQDDLLAPPGLRRNVEDHRVRADPDQPGLPDPVSRAEDVADAVGHLHERQQAIGTADDPGQRGRGDGRTTARGRIDAFAVRAGATVAEGVASARARNTRRAGAGASERPSSRRPPARRAVGAPGAGGTVGGASRRCRVLRRGGRGRRRRRPRAGTRTSPGSSPRAGTSRVARGPSS